MKLNDLLVELDQKHLVGKLQESDLEILESLRDLLNNIKSRSGDKSLSDIKTSDVISILARDAQDRSEIEVLGTEAYKNAEVAVVIVAGGQGTRLGYSGPKGCFETSLVKKKSLYQIHSEKILACSLKFGNRIPFLVMTSPATDERTREFFKENNYFGLSLEQVCFFKQGTVPSLSKDGKLLLSPDGRVVQNPDGHGGCYTALIKSGLLEKLSNQNIKHLVYIQVDNYLAPIYDPYLVGLAVSKEADVITKVVEKTKPEEKVGLLINSNGADSIEEYINLPDEILSEREEGQSEDSGKLKYRWGNTAMHYWSIDFFNSLKGRELPFHASKKPLKTKDGDVNGVKYEKFIFDLLPLAKVSLGLEIDRSCEFAPLKNKSGSDSIETIHEISSSLYRTWLEDCGVSVSLEKEIEISPLLALSSKELKKSLSLDPNLVKRLKGDSDKIYLE